MISIYQVLAAKLYLKYKKYCDTRMGKNLKIKQSGMTLLHRYA